MASVTVNLTDVGRSIERESEKFGGPVSAVGSLYPPAVLELAESAVLMEGVLSL